MIINPIQLKDIPLTETSADDGDYLILQNPTSGQTYKITKANLLTGLSSGNSGGTSSPIVEDGLVFHIDAGDTKSYSPSNNVFRDIAGNATAYLIGATYSDTDKSFHFTGGAYAIFTTPMNIVTGGNLSIDIWAKWQTVGSSVSNIQAIIDNNHTGSQGFVMQDFPQAGNKLGTLPVTSNATPGNGTWVNLGFTLSNSQAKIYINGSIDNSASVTGGLPSIQPYITLGKWQGGSRYLNGDIGIVRLYNTALTGDQMLFNYNASKSRFGL